MLQLSARTLYGISAVFELACNHGQGPVKVEQISDSQEIPRNYLDQILLELKKAGLVVSRRGAHGGYILETEPDEVEVGEVIEILEGEVELATAANINDAVLEDYWENTAEEIESCFKTTFQELVDDRDRRRGTLNYSI